jgi:hypothetical protein
MPLEEVDPDTDLSICVASCGEREGGRERPAGSYLARQQASSLCVRSVLNCERAVQLGQKTVAGLGFSVGF